MDTITITISFRIAHVKRKDVAIFSLFFFAQVSATSRHQSAHENENRKMSRIGGPLFPVQR
jgi:hypothetical protein